MARWSVLGARTVRRRFGRFVLTAVGVALGIGVLLAVLITNATIDEGLSRLLGRQDARLIRLEPAGGYTAEFPASVIEQAAKLPGVASSYGWNYFQMRVPNKGADDPHREIWVGGGFGRDGTAKTPRQPKTAGDVVTDGRHPADGSDEIQLFDVVADDLHARIGSTVEFVGPSGPHRFRVVGIDRRRDGKPSDNWSAEISFTTATRLIGHEGRASGGNVQLGRAIDVSKWLAAHSADLGPAVTMNVSNLGADAFRDVLRTGKAALAGLAAVALFVSGFLIFLTLSMSVAEATEMHGTMRAIGASRKQITRVVLGDALALVVGATPVGLVFGALAALVTIRLTRQVYGLPHLPTVIPPGALIESMLVGVSVTFVAAWLPARRASRVPPVVAMRTATEDRTGAGRWWPVGLASIALGLVIVAVSNQRMDGGSVLIMFGAVVLVPVTIGPITDIAGRLTRRLARGVGAVGVLHLRREPRRSATTLALVMIVLSMVFSAGAVHLSLRRNVQRTMSALFPADIGVFASSSFDDPLINRVASTAGVRGVAGVWYLRATEVSPRGMDHSVTVIDPEHFFDVQPLRFTAGSQASVRAALARGGAVAIPTGVQQAQHLGVGDVMRVRTPHGVRPFRVAGVYESPQAVPPLLLGTPDGRGLFDIASPTLLAVAVSPGHDPAAVKAALEHGPDAARLIVRLTRTQRADFLTGQTRFFNIVYAIVLISLLMGTLGVANTLGMAVLRRTREIGILRAVGTERRLLRRMAVVESTTIGLAGLLLAIPLGMVLSYTVLQSVARASGTPVGYVYPWPMFAVVAPLAVAVGVVSAIVPSRHIGRVDPARVLRFD